MSQKQATHLSDQTTRKILVIDDHVASWKPVLKILQSALNKKMNCEVEIHISEDTENYWKLNDYDGDQKYKVKHGLPDFDLILLDIYLGRNVNGLEFLEKIRSRIMHLPVVLWTTSTDKELPSQAALANGFIFKKTAKVNEIAEIIIKWLSMGRSQRLWSLPNPFFDYALRDPELREVALAFTKWTLRYMDCFHAVDHFYFKYFNDHGGRHILGLMDTTAKLLRPFLFQDSLLSEDDIIRNKQLFCLYIAILCHEFGMFPIYRGEGQPDSWKAMEDTRKLHAIRGMLMLLSKEFGDDQFLVQGLNYYIAKLEEVVGKKGLFAIALLVGYHQRCLDLSKKEIPDYTLNGFEDANVKAIRKFGEICGGVNDVKSQGQTSNWKNWEYVAHETKVSWVGALKEDEWAWELMPIRQMCAILRFGDALDVDHTRVPADFLLNQRDKRRSLQDVEDCKRQVLSGVYIDQGIVALEFFAPEPSSAMREPCQIFINEALLFCKDNICNIAIDKEKEDFANIINFDPNQQVEFFEEFKTPWPFYGASRDLEIEKYIKKCLQIYFTYAKLDAQPSAITPEIKNIMAILAAILVIFEIEDEYEAIKNVELNDVIRLNLVSWSKDPGEFLPSILHVEDKNDTL